MALEPVAAASPPAPRRAPRLPRLWSDRVQSVAVTLGVALVIAGAAFVDGAGSALGAKTFIEVALLVVGGGLVATALIRVRALAARPGVVSVALLALYAGVSALSITWALDPSGGWLVANQLFAYLAAFAGTVALAWLAPRRWPSVVGGVVLASVAICGYGLLTKALPGIFSEFELFARLRAPFGYWNAVGLAGALAVPACLWLGSRREGHPLLGALAYPALAVCLAATLMAYSRGALFAALVGTALWFALSPRRLRGAAVLVAGGAGATMIAVWTFGQDALTTDRAPLEVRTPAGLELLVLAVAVLGLLLAVGLAAGFSADLRPLAPHRRRAVGAALIVAAALTPFAGAAALATTDEGLGGSISAAWRSVTDTSAVGPANDPSRLTATGSVRSRYWEQAFEIWKTEKLRGVGAAGYATARLRYREDLLDVRHAHGFVPETMAELGLVGLAIVLALLVAWLAAARRAVAATAGRDRDRAGIVTLTAVAVIFGVHSALDFTWTIPGVALVGLVCAGWVAGSGGRTARERPAAWPASGPRLVAAWGVVLLVLAAGWSVWQPLRSVQAADEGFAAMDAGQLDRARALMWTAHDRNPLAIDPLLDLAAVEHRAGRDAVAEAALVEATRIQPANWLAWLRLADHRLFELEDAEGAMRAIRVAIYLNPQSWDVTQRYLDVRRKLNES